MPATAATAAKCEFEPLSAMPVAALRPSNGVSSGAPRSTMTWLGVGLGLGLALTEAEP